MKKNEPEIRFKGFEDEWEDHDLNYYLVVSTEKNQSEEYDKYDIYSVSREYGVINQIEYQGKSFAGASLSNYGVVFQGDVVYTKSPLKSQPYGIIKTNEGKTGIVSALYGVFHPTEQVSATFVQTYFELDGRLNDYLRPLVNKGAKNTLLISDSHSLTGKVTFPKKEEQEKLVALFSSLDKLIRKLELKLEKLRNIKQSLLDQMFANVKNRGGYALPRIRFKRHNDVWQMKKAVDIFVSFEEKNHPELPVLSANQELGMVARNDIGFNVQHDHRNESEYKRVMPGQFVIHLRSFQGGFAHSEIEGITSPAYTVMGFKSSSEHYDGFWKYLLTSKDFIKSLETVTYGIRDGRSIGFEDFGMLMQTYPRREEQKQIAKLLIITDDYIKMNDAKLTKIRTMKQSLLQKMFA